MAAVKIIELIGTSGKSSDDAVQQALTEARSSLRNIKAVDVVSTGLRGDNLDEWRAHILARLHRQVEVSADPVLESLLKELSELPHSGSAHASHDYAGVLVPLRFVTDAGVLSFFSTTTIFGTPVDITLSEIALESFFPADAETAVALQRVSTGRSGSSGS